MWPGPDACNMINGRPARKRVQGLDMGIELTVTVGSCHSSTWWGKYTPSPAARFQSATALMPPSTWTLEWPAWMRVLSFMAGSSLQPPEVVRSRTATGAPHEGQLSPPPGESRRQYGQVYVVAVIAQSVVFGWYIDCM